MTQKQFVLGLIQDGLDRDYKSSNLSPIYKFIKFLSVFTCFISEIKYWINGYLALFKNQ